MLTLSYQGVRFAPGGIRKGAAGHDVAFIHPKGNDEFPVGGGGVLIELVQAPPDVIRALTPKDDLEEEYDDNYGVNSMPMAQTDNAVTNDVEI